MMIDYTGQQIGSYRLVRRLGSGGFASVYEGQHVRIATQQAAIKLLHLFDVDTKKFQQEAETTAALVHPHIIRLFDFDFHNQTPFLVIDYAPGGSLRDRHPAGTQLPLPTVVQYVQQIASALTYAHGKNVIHRDIKPDNVLIGAHGELRLSDFGIAVLSQTGRTTLAPSSGIGGTAYYMAPEQSRGKPEKASDQYALGIMVYEWLCGKPPFSEGNAINIQYQHAYEPVPSLRKQLPTLPPAVEQVIMRALAKDPKDRFTSVQEFATALEHASQIKQKEKDTAARTLPSRNSWWISAIRGIIALLFGLAAFIVFIQPYLFNSGLFGIYALVDGMVAVGTALDERFTTDRWRIVLLEGLVDIVFGILALFLDESLLYPPYVTAIWALVMGILEMASPFTKQRTFAQEWTMVIGGITSVALSVMLFFKIFFIGIDSVPTPTDRGSAIVMLFFNAGITEFSLLWLTGIFAIISGIMMLARSVQFKTSAA